MDLMLFYEPATSIGCVDDDGKIPGFRFFFLILTTATLYACSQFIAQVI
jgi:hypothetical protein